jgi:disulfide bond formation protein DsbB
MNLYAPVVSTLGALALAATAGGLALIAAVLTPGGRRWLVDALAGSERHPIAWAALVALLSMSGSLYLSDIVGLVPCLLCWYQRIAMYPLVLVLGVGAFRADTGVWRYALPLAGVGLLIAAYHGALQLRPSLDVVSCNAGAPCTGRYLAVFGFISIPVMAVSAFVLLVGLLLVIRALDRER